MHGDRVRSFVTLNPASYPLLAKAIEKEINHPEIRVRIFNGHILLEGFANSDAESQRAELIAKMFVQDIVVDQAYADRKILKRSPL